MAHKDTVPIVNQKFVLVFVPERLTQLLDIALIRIRACEAESAKETNPNSARGYYTLMCCGTVGT
jgi:hypothetical protein